MSAPRRRRPPPKRAGRPAGSSESVELWRRLPPLPELQPVVPTDDPTALIRSLGDPSLPGNQVATARYVESVVERAARFAAGLAAASGLLAPSETDGAEPDSSV